LYLNGRYALLTAFLVAALAYVWRWFALERAAGGTRKPRPADVLIGFAANFLDTLGIGSFAPTTAIFKMQQRMSPLAAFPIMMGSCALLMPVGGARFVRTRRYEWLRWLVVIVVMYAAALMLVSGRK
jgi:uncharacterized membrane protein YfcA